MLKPFEWNTVQFIQQRHPSPQINKVKNMRAVKLSEIEGFFVWLQAPSKIEI